MFAQAGCQPEGRHAERKLGPTKLRGLLWGGPSGPQAKLLLGLAARTKFFLVADDGSPKPAGPTFPAALCYTGTSQYDFRNTIAPRHGDQVE